MLQRTVIDRFNMIANLKRLLPTAFGVTASMVGSVTLVAPIYFTRDGVLLNLLLLLVFGAIYMKTCQLWARHAHDSEDDVTKVAETHLGVWSQRVLSVNSGLTLIMVAAVYFVLFNQTLYKMVAFILEKAAVDSKYYEPTSDGIHFQRFSVQYLGLISGLFYLPAILSQNLQRIIKITRFGVLFLGLLLVLYLSLGVFFLADGSVGPHFSQLRLFPKDLEGWTRVLGLYSFAFICHPTILSSLSILEDKSDGPLTIGIAYVLTVVIYCLYGGLGTLVLLGKWPFDQQKTSVLDYFHNDYLSLPIGLSFCCYLVLILPVFPLVSRLQILPAVMSREKADSPLVSRITGIVQLGFIMAMQLANVNIGIAIGITGAVMAFLVCFLYPIIQHLQCNYLQPRLSVDSSRADLDQPLLKRGQPSLSSKLGYGALLVAAGANMVVQIIQIF